MQYDENAEKYGYEGEMTPMKCDELKAYKGDVYIPVYGSIADAKVYLKSEADKVISRHKYKRCLAMAKWCMTEYIQSKCLDFTNPEQWYWRRWHIRWRGLAKKFKEVEK